MNVRFPSLIRLPKNKRFGFEPRYYDPIKEEIAERTERIRREMNGAQADESPYVRRIQFERRSEKAPASSFLQLVIAAILGLVVVGWLWYGNAIFYLGWVALPIYVYFRFVKPRKN